MSLLILDHVNEGLKASAELAQMVGPRIYPLAIPEGADMPFVVVSDATIEPQSLTKDGGCDYDEDMVMVVAVARKLGEATKVARAVRKALENHAVSYADFEVESAWMEKAKPNYNQDLRAYVWEMTFGFDSNDN